jgi:AAA domain
MRADDHPSEEYRSPFIVCDDFLETAFERRFQGLLRHAWKHRSWHIIAALPGSGKSWGIGDLLLHSGARKEATGTTRLPMLAIRAPTNSARELALATALAAAFGIVPRMAGAALRLWLVQEMARDGVECIIIDDAQELTLEHLALLKELTDNLAAPPYQRHVGLCLVAAVSGTVVPFREILAGPEIRWRQFRRRMDTEHPYHLVPGHTEEEVCEILTTFEELYRSQLPCLQLRRWTKTIFTWLTNPILDPDATGRVTMDHLSRLLTSSLRRAYELGASDVDATMLQAVADLMILRRDEITWLDRSPSQGSDLPREVG